MDKRERIRKYFKPFPRWAVFVLILGIPLTAVYGLGLLLVILGIWNIASWKRKPNDRQMDAWIEEDLGSMEKQALERTGLDESELVAETVLLTGLRFWKIGGAEIGILKGEDAIIRFTPIGVTVLNFTKHQ